MQQTQEPFGKLVEDMKPGAGYKQNRKENGLIKTDKLGEFQKELEKKFKYDLYKKGWGGVIDGTGSN